MSDDKIRYIQYRCSTCDSEDIMKLFSEEPIPQVLNCNQCGAGRGMDGAEQLMRRKGMFPVVSSENTPIVQ